MAPIPKASPNPISPLAPSLAEAADPHRLYERSVQTPEAEVAFVSERFRLLTGRPARVLREDFCGTAAVSCAWVRRHPDNQALGLDLDPGVLTWARRHNLPRLPAVARGRCTLRRGDVLKVRPGPVDAVVALNFSYWVLKDRVSLLRYFRRVRQGLAVDGVFFLDAFGGSDAVVVCTEERAIADEEGTFTYLWEQAHYNPIDGALTCHIHFEFPDGSRLERAFSYDWRLWTLPELREVLAQAGFSRVVFYWQGWRSDGEADGVFLPTDQAPADPAWFCYVSAQS